MSTPAVICTLCLQLDFHLLGKYHSWTFGGFSTDNIGAMIMAMGKQLLALFKG